jgi:hypothetical protein
MTYRNKLPRVNSDNNSIEPLELSDYGDFIKTINIPDNIYIGEEVVNTNTPMIIIHRNKKILRELFSRPLFNYTKKIRIRFHWEGIHVIGANMENPNSFIFPIPVNSEVNNWFLKMVCLPDCSEGVKPLYVSVDTFRENLVLRLISISAKIVAIIALFSLILLPFIYTKSDAVNNYIEKEILGNQSVNNITLPVLFLFIIVLFSKRFDEIFTTLKQDTEKLVLFEKGGKAISKGITVEKRNNQFGN